MQKILASLLIVLQFGCATLLQSGPDRIPVNSEPQGATVFLDGMPVGTTPMVVAVNRSAEAVITVRKDGFNEYSVDRDKVFAGWFLGNILIGGVIGMGVDLACHNQGKYTEDPIFVQLAPAAQASVDTSR